VMGRTWTVGGAFVPLLCHELSFDTASACRLLSTML